jgi:lipoprotein-anchoring transpeptidase ErfK/SrfK
MARADAVFGSAKDSTRVQSSAMRRIFVSSPLAAALYIAAGAGSVLIAPNANAASQPVDAGWQLAYADQTGYGGGFFAYMLGDGGEQPVALAYEAPQYDQPAPTPQPRVYQPAAQSYQPAPAPQPRVYQPAAQYQPAPAPRPRGLFQSFQWTPAPPAPAYQAAPRYDQSAAPQQSAAYDPAAGYATSGPGHMAHPVDPQYDRQVVAYHGDEKPGTIIIDTPHYFLYLVAEGDTALRYGIGVGRPGFTWAGVKEISAMREWPDWRPPDDMLKRRPDLPRYMAGGPDNPLGARALYLGSTLYRIHGSNEPWTIGTQVSSGCIRMRNDDVTDLYGRVKVGTKVKVM